MADVWGHGMTQAQRDRSMGHADGWHLCWWCGEETASHFWACERCRPLKEEGYLRAAAARETDMASIYRHVYDVLREHGVEIRPGG